ncbi:type IV toxin-antitoxin system AbiEi family antitoxin [Curtobacterium sp. MCPF17_002]|uniref:type IV toxin-antitoxin system AbiEi family antitoxin n=1 Tax=Curtobacterium sp. MCPF17_002 TaxID=2175645 RepID=UPI0015E8A4EF|nr:type IV toxin-antitoxin system AbiEi family antitoxin [Curtobacterium sp. MCPF17_002]WIB75905.1 type IV toxin-antitoxin system AbiEi family antitoxin [Curtobacterium sp. MCPF17_002]
MARSRLLTSDDWPESELRSAVLAGELVAVGPCWASPAEPQTPELRAAAAAWVLRDARLIASTLTAAWIWGAASRLPAPVEACIPLQVRVHVEADVRLRAVRIDDDDIARLGALRVTVPARTAVDLLRSPGATAGAFGGAEASAVHGLLAIGAVSSAEIVERLRSLGTVPMVRQAERRLRALQQPARAAAVPAPVSRR